MLLTHIALFSLEEYIKKRDGYATDLEQFHDLIQQMDQHVETLTQKKKDRAQELIETNRKLARTTARVEELKQAISNQTLSVEDVQKMQNEAKGVKEAIDRAVTLKDQRRKALWESESEIEKLWNELESFVSDYNAQLSELGLLPLVSAKGVEMKAVIDKGAILDDDQTKLLRVDIPSHVQPALLACKQEYADKLSESKWKYQEALDELEQSEEAFTEALEKLKIIEDKMDKCEDTLEGEREAQDAKLAVRQREAESMEARVASLRDPVALEEQMAQFERQCAELEALRMKYEEDNVSRKRAVCEEIEKACLEMKRYDDYCLDKIAEVQQYRKQKREMYGKLKLSQSMTSSD
jgi:kinetochore protein NDC80